MCLDSLNVQVLRDGQISSIYAKELVPGDVVEVAVGDRVPADARIIEVGWFSTHAIKKMQNRHFWDAGVLNGRIILIVKSKVVFACISHASI